MRATEVFSIDGAVFDVGIVKCSRDAVVVDKYMNRTSDGKMKREMVGVYYNYTIKFPNLHGNPSEYKRLYDKVTEPEEFHIIKVPGTTESYTFRAYITGVKDELMLIKDGVPYWGDLSLKFMAEAPART